MADEAILRVVMDGSTGTPSAPPGGGSPSRPSAGTPSGPATISNTVGNLLGKIGGSFGGILKSVTNIVSTVSGALPQSPQNSKNVNLSIRTRARLRTAEKAKAAKLSSTLATVGTAAAVIFAVIEIAKALRSMLTGAVKAVGDFATGLISANTSVPQAVTGLGESIKSATEHLLFISPALYILGGVIGETIAAFGKFMEEINKNISRYGEFSPIIAQQQAMSEVAHTLGEMRRAQQVGPELARYLRVQTEIQQKYEDAKARFLVHLLPIATSLLEISEKFLPSLAVLEMMLKSGDSAGQMLRFISDLINILVRGQQDDQPVEDPTTAILRGRVEVPANIGGV